MARRPASPLLGARELANLATAVVIWKSPAKRGFSVAGL
jgi:hypothetical protein